MRRRRTHEELSKQHDAHDCEDARDGQYWYEQPTFSDSKRIVAGLFLLWDLALLLAARRCGLIGLHVLVRGRVTGCGHRRSAAIFVFRAGVSRAALWVRAGVVGSGWRSR